MREPSPDRLIALSVAVGATLSALGWFALDGGRSAGSRLQTQTERARALGAELRGEFTPPPSPSAVSAGAPLFALTSGPGAVAEPAVQLVGLSITPRRQAALLSIDNKPAEWIRLGETVDGVTLVQVTPTKALVDTAVAIEEAPLQSQGPAKPAKAPVNGARP